MTLFINGRFLSQPVSGVQRYARELVLALDGLLDEAPELRVRFGGVVLITPYLPEAARAKTPQYQHIDVRPIGAPRGHIWEQSRLFRTTKDGVLLSLGNSGPLAHQNHVVAFHDAHIFDMPEAFSKAYRRWHRFLRPRLAQRAKGLLTVSRHAADALGYWMDIDPDRFEIIHNAADHLLRVPANCHAPEEHGLLRGGYLLSVGNQSPNKNLTALCAAHAETGADVPPLVIVGDAPRALGRATVKQDARICSLGRVSDMDISGLYKGAAGFVFPSLNEGFGIPPLEAMQLGAPVLSSNTSAMPEILGDAPIWFNPKEPANISEALTRFAALKVTEKQAMVDKGFAQAARYSWRQSAERLVACLEPLISKGVWRRQAAPAKLRINAR